MNPLDFAQLGVAGVAVIVLFLVVKEFLKFARKQEESFTEIIKNHLHDSTKTTNKLGKTVKGLEGTMRELIIFLKNSNGKKKK